MTTLTGKDLHGTFVLDRDGGRVGRVTTVHLNAQTSEPALAEVTTGWFGLRRSLVPLDGARQQGSDIVVPFDLQTILDAPNFDVDEGFTADDEARLYAHYGLASGGQRTVAAGNSYVALDRTTLSGSAAATLPEGGVDSAYSSSQQAPDAPSGEPLRSGELLDETRDRVANADPLIDRTGSGADPHRDVRNDL